MNADIEKISRNRIKVSAILVFIFFITHFFSLSFIGSWIGFNEDTMALVRGGASLTFVSILIIVALFTVRPFTNLKAGERAMLYDDLTKQNELKAMEFGGISMMLLAGVLIILTDIAFQDAFNMFSINAQDVARIIFTSGGVAAFLRFAYLETRDA